MKIIWLLLIVGQLFSTTVSGIKHPIVLVHGLFGFSGELPFERSYWGTWPSFLRKHGRTVYIATLSAAHSSEFRGEQLYEKLQEWGYDKYHLVGHSQGGKDIFYVLAKYPNVVASVSTIGTPHDGSKVANAIYNNIENLPLLSSLVWKLGDLLACSIDLCSRHCHEITKSGTDLAHQALRLYTAPADLLSITKDALCTIGIKDIVDNAKKALPALADMTCKLGRHVCKSIGNAYGSMLKQDAKRALQSLTTQGAAEFNHLYSINEDFPIYSWGTYDAPRNGYFDPIGICMQISSWIFYGDEKNDGMVGLDSMKRGKWCGELSGAHHLVAAHNGLASFPEENVRWYRTMFLTLMENAQEIESH